MHINVCLLTKNKAISVTTLHTAMNMNMICMSNPNLNLEVSFVQDKQSALKNMKKCDRLIFFDYGTSVDNDTLKTFISDFPDGYKVLIAPCVLEGVDWNQFKKKTLEGSSEPAYQRGLKFDTTTLPTNKPIGDFVSSTTDGRVFAIDTKPVLKKIRDDGFKSFEHLKNSGVKIGVLRTSTVTCHYVYESIGNIIESLGIRTGP